MTKPTPAKPRPLSKTSVRHSTQSARFSNRVLRFERYHTFRNYWISFKRIVDWAALNGRPLGYSQLVAAIHAGKFEEDGRSKILFMSDAAIVLLPSSLISESRKTTQAALRAMKNIVPDCLRFSKADFAKAELSYGNSDKSLLIDAYLSRFWVPASVCRQWFEQEGFSLPPWLKDEGKSSLYRSGGPGQPNAQHLYRAKLNERIAAGKLADTIRAEASFLLSWVKEHHPRIAPGNGRSIENAIRKQFNRARKNA